MRTTGLTMNVYANRNSFGIKVSENFIRINCTNS